MTSDSGPQRKFWQIALANLERQLGPGRNGLSSAGAATRLLRYGPNALEERRRLSLPLKFVSRFRNPLVIILLAAAAAISPTSCRNCARWCNQGCNIETVTTPSQHWVRLRRLPRATRPAATALEFPGLARRLRLPSGAATKSCAAHAMGSAYLDGAPRSSSAARCCSRTQAALVPVIAHGSWHRGHGARQPRAAQAENGGDRKAPGAGGVARDRHCNPRGPAADFCGRRGAAGPDPCLSGTQGARGSTIRDWGAFPSASTRDPDRRHPPRLRTLACTSLAGGARPRRLDALEHSVRGVSGFVDEAERYVPVKIR